MSVLIEAFSVIVRNATLEAKYPGGVHGLHQDCPNNSFCADEFLSRVGFMTANDAETFITRMAEKGLTPFRSGIAFDVALCSETTPLRPCDWLELGRWGQAPIAWLAGTKRGELHAPANWCCAPTMRQLTREEFKEQLEFVRSDGNVDVYRDKSTGEELYIGRTSSQSEQAKVRHDELYRRAADLVGELIIVGNVQPGPLEPDQRRRLTSAVPLFTEVVEINPGNYSAMWLLGKIYQRLGDFERGLSWFARGFRVNPDQPDIAREAAIAALDLGRPQEAIPFCERAIQVKPDDPGLQANLALALLFSEQPTEARKVARKAIEKDPADAITQSIVRIIDEVISGTRPCPHHVNDLQ